MRLRLFAMLLAAFVLPACIGCGGGESSYKDRVGEVDPDAPIEMPGDVGEEAPGADDPGEPE